MPDTEKREEGKGLSKGPSGTPASSPANEEKLAAALDSTAPGAEAQAAPAGEAVPDTEVPPPAGDVTGGQSIGDFADSVVSGLEHAGIATEDKDGLDLHRLDLEHMSEAFFAGWGSADEAPAGGDPKPVNSRTLAEVSLSSLSSGKPDSKPGHETLGSGDRSRMGKVSWSASDAPETNGSRGQAEPRGFSAVSDMSLASWGASEGAGAEESILEPEPEEGLEPQTGGSPTLASFGFPSSTVFADYPASPNAEPTKHDELADAGRVRAPQRIRGDQPAKPAGKVFQKPAITEEKNSPSLVWNRSSNAASDSLTPQEVIFNYFDYVPEDDEQQPATQAEPETDGLTPQEVILNYFDYPGSQSNQGSQNGNGYARPGIGTSRDRDEPITLRPSQEPISLRSARSPLSRSGGCRSTRNARFKGASGLRSLHLSRSNIAGRRPSRSWTCSRAAQGRATGSPGKQPPARRCGDRPHGRHRNRGKSCGIPHLWAAPCRRRHPGNSATSGWTATIKAMAVHLRTKALESPRETARAPRSRCRARILAADAVGDPGRPIPLAINIRSPQPFEKMLVSIAGVPEGGRLSAGVDTGGGNWHVAPRRLNGLTISLPAGATDAGVA